VLEIAEGGIGKMTLVELHPVVTIDAEKSIPDAFQMAIDLHKKAHEKCFIANSVTTEVLCYPVVNKL
jgi:organic hydroperoxide reductase OsmC/OhrA